MAFLVMGWLFFGATILRLPAFFLWIGLPLDFSVKDVELGSFWWKNSYKDATRGHPSTMEQWWNFNYLLFSVTSNIFSFHPENVWGFSDPIWQLRICFSDGLVKKTPTRTPWLVVLIYPREVQQLAPEKRWDWLEDKPFQLGFGKFSGAFAVELRDGFCDHLNTAYTAIHFDQSPLRKEVLHIHFSVLRREGTPAIWQWNPPFDVFSKNSVTSSCWCWIGKPKKEKHSKTHCEGSSNQPECFIGKNGPLHEDGPNAATIAHHARVAWRKLPQLPLTCCKKCGSSDGEK